MTLWQLLMAVCLATPIMGMIASEQSRPAASGLGGSPGCGGNSRPRLCIRNVVFGPHACPALSNVLGDSGGVDISRSLCRRVSVVVWR